MSTLSQFAPFAGGGLKSFQTGYVTTGTTDGSSFTEDAKYADVTVSSVSTSKAISAFQGVYTNMGLNIALYSTNGRSSYDSSPVTTRLTSSTNLRLGVNNAYIIVYATPRIMGRWQIAEAN